MASRWLLNVALRDTSSPTHPSKPGLRARLRGRLFSLV